MRDCHRTRLSDSSLIFVRFEVSVYYYYYFFLNASSIVMILIALIIEQQDLQGCLITRHMEYGRILSLLCVFCPGTHISAAVKRVVVKFCVMIELCRGCALSPFSGDVSRGLQMLLWPLLDCFPHLTANIWKM